jgi:hypothetical protein
MDVLDALVEMRKELEDLFMSKFCDDVNVPIEDVKVPIDSLIFLLGL